jgi:hypothetical protein
MKKILTISSFLLFCLYGCTNEDKEPAEPESDVNVVTNFIQSALYGDYKKAKTYMVPDSINQERMNMIERVNLLPDEKKGLATASINIHNVSRVNDSTTVVIYSNSFKNNWDTLKAVRQKGKWLVDFNYLFDHESDTLMNKKDSIR